MATNNLCNSALLAFGAALLTACTPGGPDTEPPMGAPTSFSPAQEMVREGGYTARCNTVHSFTLPTRMIERLNVPVGPETAVISCTLQLTDVDSARVIPAQVSGTVTALSGNTKPLDFREVVEEETISYVASFTTDARVAVRFDVTITDPETGVSYEVDFEQTRV